MYKILLNVTDPFTNQLFLRESGISLSRVKPIVTVQAITKEIERNIKCGTLIDVLGNTGIEVSEKISKRNEKILYGLKLKTYNTQDQKDIIEESSSKKNEDNLIEEVKNNGLQEEKEEEKEVVVEEDKKEKAEKETKSKSKKK